MWLSISRRYIHFICVLLSIDLCWSGDKYFKKCYCPGTDPALASPQFSELRELMYEKRREYTNAAPGFPPIHYFGDIPEDGVPPRDVLKKMFPDKKLTPECVVQVSMTDFEGWVETMKTGYEQRQTAVGNIINSTSSSNGGRRKRSTFVKPDAFCASLLPSNSWTYGINPKVQGNSIDEVKKAAIICECKNAPWKRVRKQIKYKYCYSENLVDPKNDEFKSLKIEIEKNMDDILSSNENLLTWGYAGAQVLSVKLDTLGESRKKRDVHRRVKRTEESSQNTTVTKECKKIDTVVIETEMVFGGDTKDDPKTIMDTTVEDSMGDFNLTEVSITREAICVSSILPSWTGYQYESLPDVILDGQSIAYSCSQTQEMIPIGSEAWDPDSNGKVEATCINGAFELPPGVSGNPPTCVQSNGIICNSRPSPPESTKLEYIDINKVKFRPGEKAYYVCKNGEAIIRPNGTNMFEIPCEVGVYNFNTELADGTGWPTCQVEPICDNLPNPPEASQMIKATEGDSVRLGDYVVYECEKKDEYWEIPTGGEYDDLEERSQRSVNGPTIKVLCDKPVSGTYPNEKGVADVTATNILKKSWPVCAQLPCVCLGDSRLQNDKSKQVLRFECNSTTNFESYRDVTGNAYIIPKVENCGTYKPDNPTWKSRCDCPDLEPPLIVWNELQVIKPDTVGVWNDYLGRSDSKKFKAAKERIEQELDKFYIDQDLKNTYGYMRTVVTRFEEGADHDEKDDKSYVKAIVQYQFRAGGGSETVDLDCSLNPQTCFQQYHAGLLKNLIGKLNPDASDPPVPGLEIHPIAWGSVETSSIKRSIICSSQSISRISEQPTKFNISGAITNTTVGNKLNVTCYNPVKLFTKDIWDGNMADNVLHIICRPDKYFDVPPDAEMPNCLAKCPAAGATAYMPNATAYISLDISRTNDTEELWEGQKLWYKCDRKSDGTSVVGPNGKEEGSDDLEISYDCDGAGNYTFEIDSVTNEKILPKCLERPKRCRCLGEFNRRNYSRDSLNMFCRNDTEGPGGKESGPIYRVMDSLVKNMTGAYIPQIVPNKTRCGNLDPVEMNQTNKCFCLSKDGKGADGGYWITLEILNIPWNDSLLDFNTEYFDKAKLTIEKAVDTRMLLADEMEAMDPFNLGFVRTIAMRFWKGPHNLNDAWQEQYNITLANATTTNASNLEELSVYYRKEVSAFEGISLDFLIDDLDLNTPPLESSGLVTINEVFSTMVEIEVQFMDDNRDGLAISIFRIFFSSFIVKDGWVDNTLWIDPACLAESQNPSSQVCPIREMRRCENSQLSIISAFKYTHSNKYGLNHTQAGQDKDPVSVGSAVNLFCEDNSTRIRNDELDDDPYDFNMTVLCQPTVQFNLPSENFPKCRAWCPANKTVPPTNTGLILSEADNNTREYWQDDSIDYICANGDLGLEASNNITITYSCIWIYTGGMYTIPTDDNEWPICMERTTTIKTPIITGLKALLGRFDRELTKREKEKEYISTRDQGDPNYYFSVFTPCFILLTILVCGCMCCSRTDNPLCQLCFRDMTKTE